MNYMRRPLWHLTRHRLVKTSSKSAIYYASTTAYYASTTAYYSQKEGSYYSKNMKNTKKLKHDFPSGSSWLVLDRLGSARRGSSWLGSTRHGSAHKKEDPGYDDDDELRRNGGQGKMRL